MSLFKITVFAVLIKYSLCQSSQSCTDGDIQLADGRGENEGRVEVCSQGVWGTVCDDDWDVTDTAVACKQLGYGNRGYSLSLFFPLGTGLILLDDVMCIGNETRLTDCQSLGRFEHNCNHMEDIGIVCLPSQIPPVCEDGDVQLVGGTSPHNGRIEFCQFGVWGTICDSLWDRVDSMVACRQLGINATAAYIGSFLRGSGPVFLYQVRCTGEEDSIANCSASKAPTFCNHNVDASIFCSTLEEPECNNNDVRLVDGETELEGRVEVCLEGLWGNICDERWRAQENGLVVCRQVGINATGALFGKFGIGTGPFHLSSIFCSGTEESIWNCRGSISHLRCRQSQSVGVICLTNEEIPECDERSVRLNSSGTSPAPSSGIVEVCFNGRWSRVCDNSWDKDGALVVCKELGFTSSITYVIGYLMNDSQYSGQVVSAPCNSMIHNSLYSCIGRYTCTPQEYSSAAVICEASAVDSQCTEGSLRLADSNLANEGRLEVCYLGLWGTVCDDNWNLNNAEVACRQLGFSTEGATFTFTYNPQGTGPIVLDGLMCTGDEQSILVCNALRPNDHDCQHFEDVGLYCQATTNSPVTVPASSIGVPASTVAVVCVVVVVFVLLLIGAGVLGAVMYTKFRKKKKKKVEFSINPAYSLEELTRDVTDDENAAERTVSNEYDIGLGLSSDILRPPKTPNRLLSPPGSKVRGSFIRQLTEDFIIPLNSLALLVKIGEGEFGIVYKARMKGASRQNEIVAVKTLKGSFSQKEINSLMDESLKLKHFQHRNILSLIGVCVEASPSPYIVMPFMSNGSLLKYLRKEKLMLVLSDQVDEDIISDVTKRLTTMCQQISMGMRYLAGENFVHRDLAARNCMIDEHGVIKIADFGLSEDIYSKTYFRQGECGHSVKLPVKWMALESLQEGIFSEKTDVWSFGVTCWEVFTGGKNPYPAINPMGVIEMLERGERLTKPNNAACTKKLYSMMSQCWLQNPNDRPTFKKLTTMIDKYLEELVGYLEFNLFPEIHIAPEGQVTRGKMTKAPLGRTRSSTAMDTGSPRLSKREEQMNITINVL